MDNEMDDDCQNQSRMKPKKKKLSKHDPEYKKIKKQEAAQRILEGKRNRKQRYADTRTHGRTHTRTHGHTHNTTHNTA